MNGAGVRIPPPAPIGEKNMTEKNEETPKEKKGKQKKGKDVSPQDVSKKGVEKNEIKENKEKVAENGKEEEKQILEIVRFMSTDLNGKLKIKNSLRKIKGISFMTSKIFCEKAEVDPDKLTGKLDEKDIKRLEDVIKNPKKFNMPDYILNLRKNPYTGKDGHLTGSELQIEIRKILGDKKRLGSYVGIRHRFGLPVRGQRTRSTFRKNRTVGVSKRKRQPGNK